MMEKWIEIARRLSLTADEKLIVARLQREQSAQSLFALFGVFKAHGFAERASELLAWTLLAHPDQRDLQVELAQEFFELGLIDDTWQCLKPDLNLAEEGGKALNILFQCSVLLKHIKETNTFLDALLTKNLLDAQSRTIAQNLHTYGFDGAWRALKQSFHDRRIDLSLDGMASPAIREIDADIRSRLVKVSAISGAVPEPRRDNDVCWHCLKRLEKWDRRLEYRRSSHSEQTRSL